MIKSTASPGRVLKLGLDNCQGADCLYADITQGLAPCSLLLLICQRLNCFDGWLLFSVVVCALLVLMACSYAISAYLSYTQAIHLQAIPAMLPLTAIFLYNVEQFCGFSP